MKLVLADLRPKSSETTIFFENEIDREHQKQWVIRIGCNPKYPRRNSRAPTLDLAVMAGPKLSPTSETISGLQTLKVEPTDAPLHVLLPLPRLYIVFSLTNFAHHTEAILWK